MERTYYILRNNQQEGPFTRQEILQMALPDQTLLWSEGWTRWLPLAEVDDFSPTQEGGELPRGRSEKDLHGSIIWRISASKPGYSPSRSYVEIPLL